MKKQNKITKWLRQNTVALIAILISVSLVGAVGAFANSEKDSSTVINVGDGGVLNIESLTVEASKIVEAVKDGVMGAVSFIASASGFTDVNITNDLKVDGEVEFEGGAISFGDQAGSDNEVVQHHQIKDWPSDDFKLDFDAPGSTTSTLVEVRFDFSGTASQVASSTYRFGCGISTSTDRLAYSAPEMSDADDVINMFEVVTSSLQVVMTSTSTKSVYGLVEPSKTLVCYGQFYSMTTGICDKDGVECEAVTSTNRGFTAQVYAIWEEVS